MLIGLSLLILGVIMMLGIILGGNYIGSEVNAVIDNNLVVNGSTSTLEFNFEGYTFAIDPVEGAIVVFVVVITICALLGITILSSGLSDASVRNITFIIAYGGLWGILSGLSVSLIKSIEVYGGILYISLTVMYVAGVLQKLTSGG
jgi:hypothetical protein